jgi:hypothetical protein
MAIKRFDSEPKGEKPAPTSQDQVKASPFSPWLGKNDDAKRGYGEKVYGGEDAGGKYNKQDLAEAMLVKATEAYTSLEKVVKLYDRATKNPTRSNVLAYTTAIREVVGENENAQAVLSVAVAVLVSSLGGSGKGRTPFG